MMCFDSPLDNERRRNVKHEINDTSYVSGSPNMILPDYFPTMSTEHETINAIDDQSSVTRGYKQELLVASVPFSPDTKLHLFQSPNQLENIANMKSDPDSIDKRHKMIDIKPQFSTFRNISKSDNITRKISPSLIDMDEKTDVLKHLHASDGSTNIKPYAEYLLDQNNPWGTNTELLCKEDMRCNNTFSKVYSIDTCIKMVINMKYRHNYSFYYNTIILK